MADYLSGGQNQVDFFRVKLNEDDTYSILSGLTGDSAITDRQGVAHTLKLVEEAPPQFQEGGTVNISFSQYEDTPQFNDFLNAFNPPVDSNSDLKEIVLENSVKIGGSSSSEFNVLMVQYGAENETEIKMLVALGKIKKTSGSHSTKYGEYSKPTLEFEGIKPVYKITLPSAIFDATKLSATDVGTKLPELLKNQGFLRKFVTKAS